jgi:hydrogenase maturation protease
MADDGIGHAVVRRLMECGLPSGIRLHTIEGDVLALAELWNGEQSVWLVDAVSGDCPAGTLRVFEHRELLGLPAIGLSTHQMSVSESLRWLLHGKPEMAAVRFRLYGVEVGVLRPEQGLSRVVKESVCRLVDEIRAAVG